MKNGERGGICESALFPPLAPLPLVWPLCPLDGPHRGNLSWRACGYCAEGTSLLVTLSKVSLYSVQQLSPGDVRSTGDIIAFSTPSLVLVRWSGRV